MKKHTPKVKNPPGLSMELSSEKSRSENKNLIWITNVLIVFAGVFAALFSFTSAYGLSEFTGTAVAASLICGGACGFLYGVKKFAKWFLPIGAAVLALVCFWRWEDFQGFGVFLYNKAARLLMTEGFGFTLINGGNFYDFNVTLVWFATAFAFGLLIGFFAVFKVHCLPVLILTFIPLELGLYFGLVPNIIAVACFFACNGAVLARSLTAAKFRHKKTKNPADSYGVSLASLIVCLFFTAAVLAGYGGVAVSDYERPASFDKLRNEFINFDFSSLMQNQEEIDLSLQGDRVYNYETDITLETPLCSGDIVYLKGSTGSVYGDNKWTDFEPSVYEEEPLPSMERSNISVSELYASDISGSYDIGVMNFTLAPELRGRTFLPYGAYSGDAFTADRDKGAFLSGKAGNYTVSFDTFANSGINSLYGSSAEEERYYYTLFSRWQNDYTLFVNRHYTQLPEGLGGIKAAADEISASLRLNTDEGQKIAAVQNYLKINAEYSLEPGFTPGGEDFAEYFLFENHKGYCVHFATAGVLLLRAMGVPARYAEGYAFTRQEYLNGEESEHRVFAADCRENGEKSVTKISQDTGKIELKDSNAHAWAEVYTDEYGWVPCEMTPGSVQPAPDISEPVSDTVQQTEQVTAAQAVTTEPAEITVAVGGVSDAEGISVTETQSTSSIFAVVIVLAAVLLLILADIFVRRIVVHRRSKSFRTENAADNLTAMYNYLKRLLALSGFKPYSGENLTEEFERLFRTFDFLDEKECVDMVIILQKAFYGNSPIMEKEQTEVRQFVSNFEKSWLSEQSGFKRFIYKYLLFV